MLLITIFVELRVVAGRSRKRAGSPQAVSRRPYCAVALGRTAWSENGMGSAWAWHGKCELDTAALFNQMGKTHSKPLAAQHGHGMLCLNRPLGEEISSKVTYGVKTVSDNAIECRNKILAEKENNLLKFHKVNQEIEILKARLASKQASENRFASKGNTEQNQCK